MQCILPKSRTFVILITFLDDSKRFFKIPIKQKGSAALINITNSITVDHKEYFGLKYSDRFHKSHWINLDKSLHQQLKKSHIEKTSGVSNEPYYNMEFEVRYYPRDPTSIDDENCRYQIFLQIRKDLGSMKLVIKNESILSILCGLILQSDFGDYSGNRFAPHYIRQTISTHLLTPVLEEKIKNEHIKLRGVEPVEAEYQFLEKIRWLENYGTIIFPVKNHHNKYCYLGLNPQGFSLRFQKEPNLNYDIFWPRVSTIKRKGRQIIIKEKTDTTKKHYFETGEKLLCLSLYKLSLNHFAFFKLKKDEKPAVIEPPKRSFSRSASKEFGYSSDTSDYNQYSDDTFSSYPDSINTTQSSKTTKGFKKTILPPRNCTSDAEESALSRKNRRVIVSKSQTETEDEGFKPYDIPMKNNTFDFSLQQKPKNIPISHSQSYDRIPPDYIYENRLTKVNAQSHELNRPKRMRKRVTNQSSVERKIQNFNENEPKNNKVSDNMVNAEKKYRSPSIDFRNDDPENRLLRHKSDDIVDAQAKMQRQLPLPNILPPHSQNLVKKNEYRSTNYRINQSASVDSISGMQSGDNRVSPTKRMLPNLSVVASMNSPIQPAVPKHRIQPKAPPDSQNPIKTQSHYADIWYKPAYTNDPPQVPKHSNVNQRKPISNYIISERQPKVYKRPAANYQSRLRPESGL